MYLKLMLTGILTTLIIIPLLIMLSDQLSDISDNEKLEIFEKDFKYEDANDTLTTNSSFIDTTNDFNSKVHTLNEDKENTVLIDLFSIIKPEDHHFCTAINPWSNGFTKIKNGGVLAHNDCFAFLISTIEASEIYLLSHSESGKLIKLFPNNCNKLETINSKLKPGEKIILPQDELGKHLLLSLDDKPGREWFYSIAVSSLNSRSALHELINNIPDICEQSTSYTLDVIKFQEKLKNLQHDHNNDLQWLSKSFIHY